MPKNNNKNKNKSTHQSNFQLENQLIPFVKITIYFNRGSKSEEFPFSRHPKAAPRQRRIREEAIRYLILN
jgi:hypothetical protein